MRILEVSDIEGAAAFCGKLFRRWGHEVVRVESPTRDEPEAPADLYLHGGKHRVALDLDDPHERERLDELARTCDVAITDRSVTDIERLRLLDLGGDGGPGVRLALTPFGLTGPYVHAPATEASLLALGGYSYIIGDPDRAPLTFVGRYASYQSGTLGYVVALAVARAHGADAAPVRIDLSLMECLATLHQSTYSRWLETGLPRGRAGNRMDSAANSLLPTRDGWVGVSFQQQFWFAFATMIGRPDLAEDHHLASNAGRLRHYDELVQVVDEVFRERDTQELFDEAQGEWRIPIGKLLGVLEALDDPHLVARDFWRSLEGAPSDESGIRVPGSSFRLMDEPLPAEPASRPPGADTEEVLAALASGSMGRPRRAASMTSSSTRPLEGVRVLDLSRVWAGPVAGRILGDLGADVIKIEAPTNRGPREVPPGTRGYLVSSETTSMPWNAQTVFNQLQRNRRSVCIDLKTDVGKEVFLRLVEQSDVVLENFSARAMSRLGLGYDVMRTVNQRIIYMPMPAFGRTGPYRDFVGLGTSVEPLAAIPTLLGYPGGHAHTAAIAIPDPMAGTTAAAAILTALERRDETGLGCEFDFSQQETAIGFLGEYFIEAQLTGRDQPRVGNEDPRFAPHNTYRCRGEDAWIAIAARDEREWRALARAAGRAWQEDERFRSANSRLAHRHELDSLIEEWTSKRDKHELQRELMAAAVPAGAVLTGPELVADPHLEARGYFAILEHPVTGQQRFDGAPWVIDGERGYDRWRPTPMLGEHNAEVLESLAGLQTEDLQRLTTAGVLTTTPLA